MNTRLLYYLKISRRISHGLKNNNMMIISLNAEKALDKVQHLFMVKVKKKKILYYQVICLI